MADEIRVTRDAAEDVTLARGTRAETEDPDAALAGIEQTRARMSETIDEIEGALVRRKEQIQGRLDVFAVVRERPLPSAGLVFLAGLLLGLLTGGGEDEEDEEHDYEGEIEPSRATRRMRGRHRVHARRHAHADDEQDGAYWQRRAETWESRARRLRGVAHEQEEELRSLQETWGEERARRLDREPGWRAGRAGGRVQSAVHGVRESLTEGLAGFISQAIDQFSGHGASSRRH